MKKSSAKNLLTATILHADAYYVKQSVRKNFSLGPCADGRTGQWASPNFDLKGIAVFLNYFCYLVLMVTMALKCFR